MIHATLCMNLKSILLSERHKNLHFLWFYLYKIFKKAKKFWVVKDECCHGNEDEGGE